MSQLKVIKVLLVFAAMFFIAKPFLGYKGFKLLQKSKDSIILVKAFAKRKPEYFEEAEIKKASIQQLLTNPPAALMFAIAALLAFLFPLVYRVRKGISSHFIDQISLNSLHIGRTYLLTGKLTI